MAKVTVPSHMPRPMVVQKKKVGGNAKALAPKPTKASIKAQRDAATELTAIDLLIEAKRKTPKRRRKEAIKIKTSVKTLEAAKFDPILEAVRLFDEITVELLAEQAKERPSGIKIASLYNTKQKINSDLIRFGYARVSETVVIEQKEIKPISIHITKPDKPMPKIIEGEVVTTP